MSPLYLIHLDEAVTWGCVCQAIEIAWLHIFLLVQTFFFLTDQPNLPTKSPNP